MEGNEVGLCVFSKCFVRRGGERERQEESLCRNRKSSEEDEEKGDVVLLKS